jgi:hypothetical protein
MMMFHHDIATRIRFRNEIDDCTPPSDSLEYICMLSFAEKKVYQITMNEYFLRLCDLFEHLHSQNI